LPFLNNKKEAEDASISGHARYVYIYMGKNIAQRGVMMADSKKRFAVWLKG
jgi:hypothetical protein